MKESVFVAESTGLTLKKSVISGFSPAVVLDDEIKPEAGGLKKIKLEEMYFQ